MKDIKEKIKRNIEELFHKLIIVSKDEIDKFEKHEMKKIIPIKRKWFEPLINKNVMGKKPKINRDKLKHNIVRDIRILFDTKKGKEERKKVEKN